MLPAALVLSLHHVPWPHVAPCAAVAVLGMHLLSAIVFGMIYFAVMCATRHHGGAHLNPAITLASCLAGVTPALQALTLIISQVILRSSCVTAV